jgi:hypothetical protein
MWVGQVRHYWSSVQELVSSIRTTTWDQTWQTASARERAALAGTIFAGFAVGWSAAVGIGAMIPAVSWLYYYALWGSLFAWLGRSRSVADAPGRDSGVQRAVGRAQELGVDIPWFPNWVRDVFRPTSAVDRADAGRLARWIDGPAGVVGVTALILAFAVTSQQQTDPVAVQLLSFFPVAFGLAASHRVYRLRRRQRTDFAEQVSQASSAPITNSGAPRQPIPAPDPALEASSHAANELRTQIVVGVAISLAIGFFFYLLPPLYH